MTAHRTFVVRDMLATTDFSAPSSQALGAARTLAEHFGARLHVLHVVADESERKTTEAKLESEIAEPIEGVKVVRAVSAGQPAAEIVKYAEREQIDVIVMGTHGRSGLARVFMGSVAEAVVRNAPCQVLTIGPRAQVTLEATPPVVASPEIPQSQCLVCAKPSPETICDSCKAHIQGEALERKRREERPGHWGLSI